MSNGWFFVLGLCIGAIVGIVVVSCCISAAQGDKTKARRKGND